MQTARKKTIWILNHYAGTASSFSTRHYDLAKELVKAGHRVTIFAAGFDHYKHEERLRPGELTRSENHDGVDFIWIRTYPYKNNSWRRVVNMLSYGFRAFVAGRKINETPDAIIGSTVHPFAVLAAYLVARKKKTRFIFEVRDLWPQSLIDAGALRPWNPIAWAMRRLETFLYRRADAIITLLPYADRYITKSGVPRNKITWIPNGADLNRYAGIRLYEGGTHRPFTLMYLGAHGKMNAIDVILDAAKVLQDRRISDVRFVLVGDGPDKPRLVQYAKEKSLGNVEFREPVPKKDLFMVMGDADAFVFNLDRVPFDYGVSSNKLFDYLASGRPIVFSANAANNPVTEAGAGLAVPARCPDKLADAVMELVALPPAVRIEMGKKGQAYLRANHDVRVLAQSVESVL